MLRQGPRTRSSVGVATALAALALSGCAGSSGLAFPTAGEVSAAGSASPAGPGGASGSGSATRPGRGTGSGPAPLRWAACPGEQAAGDECATLGVPLDRSNPGGRALDLALIRRPASDRQRRIGSLLINPGGPGGSTVKEFDGLTDQLSPGLRARFDVVGFDPRGVGSSAPVRCLNGRALDAALASSPDPLTPEGLAELDRVSREQVAACESQSGDLLPFVGTVDAAKDIDAIRAAVGDDKLTYLGYSYGTFLGATYASLFPDRVRALALDGAVDPALGPIEAAEVQAQGFQQALETFLADCQRRRGGCGWNPGGDLLPRYRELMARIARAPLATGDDARPLTPALALTGVAAALYSRESWTYLEQGLDQADRGQGRVLLALSDFLNERSEDGTYSSLVASNTAVNCRDESAPSGTAPYVASYRRLLASAPDFAVLGISGYLCSLWPTRDAGAAAPAPAPALTVRGTPPLLVVGTTGDPATPFREAEALVTVLPGSVLLTRQGEGHTGYGASACIRGHVDAYLIQPSTLPSVGTVCSD